MRSRTPCAPNQSGNGKGSPGPLKIRAKVPVVTPTPSRRPPAQALPRATLAFARPVARSLKVKAVGSFLPSLTAQAFKKFGFSTAQLIMDWPAIAGRELAAHCLPERLKWPPRPEAEGDGSEAARAGGRRGATLVLRVDGAAALA